MPTFVSKAWTDMIVQYPTRYKLVKEDLSEEIVTILEAFGIVTASGDVFDKATMDDLEARISAAFATCFETIYGTTDPTGSQGKNGDFYVKYTTTGSTSIVSVYAKINGSWIALPTGGGGATVYLGTTDPDASTGENGSLYAKYHMDSSTPVVDAFFVKISGAWASVATSGGAVYLELTQEQYDALSAAEKNNGTMYFVTDADTVIPKGVYMGTCSTAGSTAAKEVTVSSDQNFVLEKGATISVKFSNNNSASNVTISVNGTTAYPIWYASSAYTASWNIVCGRTNYYTMYVFDGSYWVWIAHSNYPSYSSMSDAEAEAGSSTNDRLIKPTVLKHAIDYHAIPQVDGNERVVGKLGNDTLYEKVFTFSYSDMQGGSRDNTRINGVFVLDSNVNYKNIMISDAQIVNNAPDNSFNVWSMPLPIASASGVYCRVQIQKSYAEPAAYDGVPFIFFDTTYNAAQLKDNNNMLYIFTIRYTKATS